MSIPHHPLQERLEHDMDVLRRRLRKISDLVLRSLEDAVSALANRDRKLAYQVVLRDNRVDVLERHIDRLCQEFLIRHMPVAGQLRFVMAVAKVNSEIERIGDYAEAIARKAVTLSQHAEVPQRERILEMAKISFQMLRQAVQAFLEGDDELAMQTLELDRQVDMMNDAIFKALAQTAGEERDLTMRFALLGLLNRLERVADRSCNIAEEAIYVTRGQVLRHLPRSDYRVLFLGEQNDSRSQMAEAIARQNAPAHFIFQSAGIRPGQLDPRAVDFMKKKKIDMSRQRSKRLEDVGNVEDFNVVVTLSHQVEEACPTLPYGAMELDWDIEDPLKATGTPAEIEKAYEAVYQDLKSKINELMEGLLGASAEREEDE